MPIVAPNTTAPPPPPPPPPPAVLTGTVAPLQPIWTSPATAGMVSNRYTSANPETFSFLYSSTGGSLDPIGQIQVVAKRLADNKTVWDSGWVGNPTVYAPGGTQVLSGFGLANTPTGGLAAIGGSLTGDYGTVTGGTQTASAAGGSIGTWATSPVQLMEPSGLDVLPHGIADAAVTTATINGTTYVYVIGGVMSESMEVSGQAWHAVLNPDGTLGSSWTRDNDFAQIVPTFTLCRQTAVVAYAGLQNGVVGAPIVNCTPGPYLIVFGGSTSAPSVPGGADGSPFNTIWIAGINADGSLGPWAIDSFGGGGFGAGGSFGSDAVCVNGIMYVTNGWAIGGLSTFAAYSIRSDNGFPGNLFSMADPPVTRADASLVSIPVPNSPNTALILIGGRKSGAMTGFTSVDVCQVNNGVMVSSWTSLTTLPLSSFGGGAAIFNPAPDGSAVICYCPGNRAVAFTATLSWVGTTPVLSSWATGAGGTLLATQLGTGGKIGVQPNGMQTVSFRYGFGTTPISWPVAGDAVSLTVLVTGAQSGVLSKPSVTAVRFSDPPQITGINANLSPNTIPIANPILGFSFIRPRGGGPQNSFRLALFDPITQSNVIDSGQQVSAANTVLASVPNPPLNPGQNYQVQATAATADAPMPGSITSVTVAQVFQTANWTLPPLPAGFTANPDPVNGWVLLQWVNPPLVNGNRIWFRPSGTSAWTLLISQSLAVGTGSQSAYAMDMIGLGVPYDYCITSYGGALQETPQGSVMASNVVLTLGPQLGMIHLAGIGSIPGNAMALMPRTVNAFPDYTVKIEQGPFRRFGTALPATRYGPGIGRSVKWPIWFQSLSQQQEFEEILQASQAAGGPPICFRDPFGTVMFCSVGDRTWKPIHQSASPLTASFAEGDLTLTETDYQFVP